MPRDQSLRRHVSVRGPEGVVNRPLVDPSEVRGRLELAGNLELIDCVVVQHNALRFFILI